MKLQRITLVESIKTKIDKNNDIIYISDPQKLKSKKIILTTKRGDTFSTTIEKILWQ